MSDSLEQTFEELRQKLGTVSDRLSPTHADPFYTFVFPPAQALELARRLRRWRGQRREAYPTTSCSTRPSARVSGRFCWS